MKSLGKKGFTLIELLAVITIMGILMLVAIPAVSRTIENARRDTFQDVAKEYIDEKDIWQEETEATPAAEVAAGRKRKSSHRWWDECR